MHERTAQDHKANLTMIGVRAPAKVIEALDQERIRRPLGGRHTSRGALTLHILAGALRKRGHAI